jgi:hypothetical protein
VSDLVVPEGGDLETDVKRLFERITSLVEQARRLASRQVNTTLALRNWHTGQLISEALS